MEQDDLVLEKEGNYEKIVTHDDFDGIVSAALCAWALGVDRFVFAGPLTITKAQITITERDVVCDLPYPLQCGLWFDHHEGTGRSWNTGASTPTPSPDDSI